MIVNIAEILNIEGASTKVSLFIPVGRIDLSADTGVILSSPITVEGVLTNRNMNEIYFDGYASTTVEMPCDRCLELSKQKLHLPIQEVFVQRLMDEEDSDRYLIKDQKIDILPVIIQALLASMPMKVVCEKECKGLCSHCGVNLNIEQCNCRDNQIDPRFESLKSLFPEDKEV
ncbi:MAG: DUF177 domain-containing protein [Epulopiscium sp.]|nr:DUF177 domain-containing protein [Candidatus Epulonipiscium sp.]